jgi:hypothetical protein
MLKIEAGASFLERLQVLDPIATILVQIGVPHVLEWRQIRHLDRLNAV